MRGGLNIGPKENPDIQKILKTQLLEGDQVLDHKEIMRRWPALDAKPNYVGIYSRDMGFIDVEAALSGTREIALKRGAKLEYKTRLISIDEKSKSIAVEK